MGTEMLRHRVRSGLACLVGKPLREAARDVSIQRFELGDRLRIITSVGLRESCEYALRISCAWCISTSERMLVASGDRFHPRENGPRAPEEFDYTRGGATLLDAKMERFVEEQCPLGVIDIDADDIGGFRLSLERRFVLEVFPYQSSDAVEHWRLIEGTGGDLQEMVLKGKTFEKVVRTGRDGV